MGQIEQIKIKRTSDNMYCVGMYIGGVLVDCANGITEAEKNDYKRLHESGKLMTPNYPSAATETEAAKNQRTNAQCDQYLAMCRHTRDNIIFNYGSIENYIATRNAEISAMQSKLQSYYDNRLKGKSRRVAIIAGLENNISIMKNTFQNTIRELEDLHAATATETPQISTETAEAVKCTTEGGTAQNEAYSQPYNVKYFVERFGNWQNFNKCYTDAIEAARTELSKYERNHRKGGSYRRRKIDALGKHLKELKKEFSLLSTVLVKYWQTSPQTPSIAATVPKRRQRPRKLLTPIY